MMLNAQRGALGRVHVKVSPVAVPMRHASRGRLVTVAFLPSDAAAKPAGPKTPAQRADEAKALLVSSKAAKESGLKPKKVYRNLSVPELYEMALKLEPESRLASSGALCVKSGEKTGRSPKDKRVVIDAETEKTVWWGAGSPNVQMDDRTFLTNRERAVDFLNFCDQIFVLDGYANWDPVMRTKIRIVCTRPYHALFMHNMLIRPTEEELANFGEPDFVIYNAGSFPANKYTNYMTSSTSIDVSIAHREMVILGTQYAGEMKKGVFTVMHYLMPKQGILSLHSGCNVGEKGDVSLFFGLSGTGKTTLSTDPRRPLIGDDEHCWGDNGVFNIEGGCYAKAINLKATKEPEVWKAIRYGTVLENIVFEDEHSRVVDYDNGSITENTRASYPIEFIDNARIPCVGPHPKNIVLLCCDAFGVLPPVSKLTLEQAMYHFISGYTAKVAGTEMGVTEPQATFSACYGAAFIMWHPMKYAAMLSEKITQHGASVWLINTGWTGGNLKDRIPLKYTRAVVDAIHDGSLLKQEFFQSPVFNLQVPKACPGVPAELMASSGAVDPEYKSKLGKLGRLFADNFETFVADGAQFVGDEMVKKIISGGPDQNAIPARPAGWKPTAGNAFAG